MHTLSRFYESIFSCKVYKLSLDAACTCPNRDGTKGWGGCIFCSESGSGEFAAGRNLPIKEQVKQAKKRVESKLRGRSGNRAGKYIAYFQNFTSTYGNSEILVQKYEAALSCEDVAGLAIATRPDCLSDEILAKIAKIAENHFVQIELGLQTANEETGEFINRCYTNEDYSDAVMRIKAANPRIHIVTHLIFGLPNESERDMIESVNFAVNTNDCKICDSLCESADKNKPQITQMRTDFFGIKITSLYVVKNTRLAELYEAGEYAPLSKEEYFSLLQKALAFLPENCVVHRLTGDPPKSTLLDPAWTADKKRVMNEIKKIVGEKTQIGTE